MFPSTKHRAAIYAIFALSGFAALVYEVLWSKYLCLTFGTTLLAVSTVTANFMGGLALGSVLLGRYADRSQKLLRIYALLELLIAGWALAFPFLISVVGRIYAILERDFPDHPAFSVLLYFSLSALVLLPPAVCMGGTLPVMCKFFGRKNLRTAIGKLYALNTLGAASGAFAAGYFLIPALGLSATGFWAVLLNVMAALGAWGLSRRLEFTNRLKVDPGIALPMAPTNRKQRLLLASVFLIGTLALGYEILWTRVLMLFLGNTSYAFAIMLSVYLVGIALGGAVYTHRIRHTSNCMRVYTTLVTIMGLSVALTAPFYDHLAHLFQVAHEFSGERWWLLSTLRYGIVFAIMIVPTLISGSLLPLAVCLYDPDAGRTGEGVGKVVLYNTLGAVAGSLVAGFLLIPWFGVQGSFTSLVLLNLLLGLALLLADRPRTMLRFTVPALAVAGTACVLLAHTWNPVLLTSGVYCYAPKYQMLGGIMDVVGKDPVLALYEGPETTVGVHETGDGKVRYFTVNGKTDGGTGADMATQTLIGQLPLLLHPSPRQVFVLGLGTGITLGTVKEHPVWRIDCAELSPEVVKASHWFDEYNRKALDDPKIKLSIGDGRNMLMTSDTAYDVIISQPSNPWQSGNANLFTSDFYDIAARRLAPGGLFCQWVGLYDITPENLKSACRTFLETFPYVLVFKENADLILVGSKSKFGLDYQQINSRLLDPHIAPILSDIGIHSVGDLVARQYLFCSKCLARFAAGAPLNTDDKPILEYSGRHLIGKNALGQYAQQNMSKMLATMNQEPLPLSNLGANSAEVSEALQDIGQGFLRIGKKPEANVFLREAERLRSTAVPPLTGATGAAEIVPDPS